MHGGTRGNLRRYHPESLSRRDVAIDVNLD
jgi:hypothetical protein